MKKLIMAACVCMLFASVIVAAPEPEHVPTMKDRPFTYLFRFPEKNWQQAVRGLPSKTQSSLKLRKVCGNSYCWLLVHLQPEHVYRNGFNRATVPASFSDKADVVLDLHRRSFYRGAQSYGFQYDQALLSLPQGMLERMTPHSGSFK